MLYLYTIFDFFQSALTSLKVDLDLSKRENFYFGAKLVRGAYMEQVFQRWQGGDIRRRF